MIVKSAASLSICLALTAGAAMLAAPGQDRPGQPTRGQIWVENRGRNEAIPVVVQDPVIIRSQEALPVQLTAQPTGAPLAVVLARTPVQSWEYETIGVPRDVDPKELTRVLGAAGQVGWEATGVQVVSGTNTLVVMKRPRP